ncbi:MAG: GAF domain-containing protein [Thermoleophilia bacterium]|nr:GAF domain-containing protein [Thermoleophilia bacterium]
MHTTRHESEALFALIARVNSSLDVDEVLNHAAAVCAELAGCEGALVYLWDEEQERLVIRGAVAGYEHWVGAYSLELGEGLTGWTALTRRPGMIAEEPLADPRYKLVPELHDARFQSVLTVPVVGRGDRLVGVLTLHTLAPHEFTDDDLTLMQAIASLVAGAVENAKLHEQAIRSMRVFRSLADLSRQMAVASRSPQTLQRLALTALELLDATLVVVLRLDEARGRLLVETWVGGESATVRADAVAVEGPWARLLGGGPASMAVANDSALVAPFVARGDPRSLFAAPLVLEGRPVGLLCCYAREQRSLSEDNLALLGTIANHAAIALEEGRVRAAADERSRTRELLDALRAGEPAPAAARALGVRPGEPHAVVMAETPPGDDPTELWAALAARLAHVFPGAVTDARRAFVALVPVRSERWSALLEQTLAETLEGGAPRAAVGYSDSTGTGGDHALAFRQARLACAIAQAPGAGRPVRGYPGLGAQRYLWAISHERDPDPLELSVGRLLELDRRRGSDLFRTLEAYLESQGNARQTAAALYVHRNTLRQRLRRIHETIGLDPADPSVAFDLQLAVRLIRFRELGG